MEGVVFRAQKTSDVFKLYKMKNKELKIFFDKFNKSGKFIISENRYVFFSPGLFLIASGGVKVMSADKDGDRIQLARLGPGDVVGEISLVLRRPATATVVAEHETVTLTLQREKFQEVIREHPVLLNELYELATKREEETRSVIGQASVDASDFVIV